MQVVGHLCLTEKTLSASTSPYVCCRYKRSFDSRQTERECARVVRRPRGAGAALAPVAGLRSGSNDGPPARPSLKLRRERGDVAAIAPGPAGSRSRWRTYRYIPGRLGPPLVTHTESRARAGRPARRRSSSSGSRRIADRHASGILSSWLEIGKRAARRRWTAILMRPLRLLMRRGAHVSRAPISAWRLGPPLSPLRASPTVHQRSAVNVCIRAWQRGVVGGWSPVDGRHFLDRRNEGTGYLGQIFWVVFRQAPAIRLSRSPKTYSADKALILV